MIASGLVSRTPTLFSHRTTQSPPGACHEIKPSTWGYWAYIIKGQKRSRRLASFSRILGPAIAPSIVLEYETYGYSQLDATPTQTIVLPECKIPDLMNFRSLTKSMALQREISTKMVAMPGLL